VTQPYAPGLAAPVFLFQHRSLHRISATLLPLSLPCCRSPAVCCPFPVPQVNLLFFHRSQTKSTQSSTGTVAALAFTSTLAASRSISSQIHPSFNSNTNLVHCDLRHAPDLPAKAPAASRFHLALSSAPHNATKASKSLREAPT
jgi:hypothetical protein